MSDKETTLDDLLEIEQIFEDKREQATQVEDQNKWTEAEHLNYRSTSIDRILFNYATQQQERYNFKKRWKSIFVIFFCVLSIVIISGAIIVCCYALKNLRAQSTEFLTCIITAAVSCFASIVSILLIIVKYIFPPDEETNFNDLVSIIVENDTKRLKDIQDKDFQQKGE